MPPKLNGNAKDLEFSEPNCELRDVRGILVVNKGKRPTRKVQWMPDDQLVKYWQDVKWDKVARLPEFLGSTGSHLRRQAEFMSNGARRSLKKENKSKVTVQEMHKWYTSSDRREKQLKVWERENHCINVWWG